MQLHNTIHRKKEEVSPMDGQTFRFYCCGPTVYGPAHIGNFRTFLVQDLFRRVLEVEGVACRHVRNITDVDDKTIRVSMEQGLTLGDFTSAWRRRFEDDCVRLNLLPPHVSPSAVEHIPQQIDLIERLMDKELAYQAKDGSVYFRVDAFPEYGKLSGIDRSEQRKNASGRQNSDDEYSKDHVADFALWKARKEEDGENYWPSPWGEGRPGWHIECSAMSMHYLGESFDLHGGGVDLIFPHHENEIAQSEGATGVPFARHWFHTAHLMVEGHKMAKSLGNLYTLSDLVEEGWHPMEIRWALLSGHYRKSLNFTKDSLHAARLALRRIDSLAGRLRRQAGIDEGWLAYERAVEEGGGKIDSGELREAWMALTDDLNVPKALGFIMKEVARWEKWENGEEGEGTRWLQSMGILLQAMGIDMNQWTEKEEEAAIPEEILRLAEERQKARRGKDFLLADQLRDSLTKAGWQVKDTPDGFEVSPL